MIKEMQVWKMTFPPETQRPDMYVRCYKELEDEYHFMPVSSTTFNIQAWDTQKITQSKVWHPCSKTIISVRKDQLDFFLKNSFLEEDIKT